MREVTVMILGRLLGEGLAWILYGDMMLAGCRAFSLTIGIIFAWVMELEGDGTN